MWKAFRGTGKTKRTEALLGCTLEFFRKYLEDLFTDGMSWENYGEWHVDHIMPLASVDSSKRGWKKKIEKLCHYTNLQPLWAKDNLSKGKKIKLN